MSDLLIVLKACSYPVERGRVDLRVGAVVAIPQPHADRLVRLKCAIWVQPPAPLFVNSESPPQAMQRKGRTADGDKQQRAGDSG